MNWTAVIVVIAVVLGVGHLAKAPVANTTTSCGSILNTAKTTGPVTITGRLVSQKIKDSGTVYVIEGSDGFQVAAWLSQDVDITGLAIGSKATFTGTVIAPGLISVTATADIHSERTTFGMSVYNTQIRGGQAFMSTGQIINTTLLDGEYPELLMIHEGSRWELHPLE